MTGNKSPPKNSAQTTAFLVFVLMAVVIQILLSGKVTEAMLPATGHQNLVNSNNARIAFAAPKSTVDFRRSLPMQQRKLAIGVKAQNHSEFDAAAPFGHSVSPVVGVPIEGGGKVGVAVKQQQHHQINNDEFSENAQHKENFENNKAKEEFQKVGESEVPKETGEEKEKGKDERVEQINAQKLADMVQWEFSKLKTALWPRMRTLEANKRMTHTQFLHAEHEKNVKTVVVFLLPYAQIYAKRVPHHTAEIVHYAALVGGQMVGVLDECDQIVSFKTTIEHIAKKWKELSQRVDAEFEEQGKENGRVATKNQIKAERVMKEVLQLSGLKDNLWPVLKIQNVDERVEAKAEQLVDSLYKKAEPFLEVVDIVMETRTTMPQEEWEEALRVEQEMRERVEEAVRVVREVQHILVEMDNFRGWKDTSPFVARHMDMKGAANFYNDPY